MRLVQSRSSGSGLLYYGVCGIPSEGRASVAHIDVKQSLDTNATIAQSHELAGTHIRRIRHHEMTPDLGVFIGPSAIPARRFRARNAARNLNFFALACRHGHRI